MARKRRMSWEAMLEGDSLALARQVERVMGRDFNPWAGKALALEILFAFRSLKSSMEL
jgi:hypothetical protein